MTRAPREAEPARIGPLASLPLFHRLEGRRCVLAGDSEGALWKAELLTAAGAQLFVFAPDHSARFEALAAHPPAGAVIVAARAWRESDLDGAALAVADVESDAEAARFVAAAHEAGAVVNVIDRPAFCDAQFGSLVNRSPLVVAISTDGAAPVFGQAIRARIEAVLPQGLKAWAQAAKDWRPLAQARELGFSARRAVWERFAEIALTQHRRAPEMADRQAFLETIARVEAQPPQGRVTLVGAGPGDPDLLTLKAVRALQSADVILYDDLVSREVLELARREAKRMLVGKTGHGPSCKQDEINALMIQLARQGRHVVRLKSGDPMIFGRAAEEMDACAAQGIPVAVVPGVSTAQAAAASLGLSLTERDVARRVQFLTLHGSDGKLPADICWEAVADPAATSVLYMPRKTLAEFSARAIASGLAPTTPALCVANVSRANEAHRVSTIAGLAALMDEAGAGPMIIILGAVARRAAAGAMDEALAAAGRCGTGAA